MKFTVQLVIEPGDGSTVVREGATLERETLTEATLGLSLAESKTILAQLQETMVAQQAASYSTAQQTCPACGAPRRCKGHHQIVVRSLFGTLRIDSPRLRRCACQPADSPRSSPLAECLLDWFHVTMRITVLRQQLKELITVAPDHDLEPLDDELERLKWYLQLQGTEVPSKWWYRVPANYNSQFDFLYAPMRGFEPAMQIKFNQRAYKYLRVPPDRGVVWIEPDDNIGSNPLAG